jgi:glycosyltransferase involved in cell wall biosynthesis
MATATEDVMVSCLMVTLAVPERLSYLRRSVRDYCRQTQRNKELVIVLDGGPPETKAVIAEHVAALRRGDIRIVDPEHKRSLGALRNIAHENAAGDILCQWDDDDLHHPGRLERQLEHLLQSDCEAVYLQEIMLFFPRDRALYWINARATGGMPHTLMCLRLAPVRYPEAGLESQIGEDLAVLSQLQQRDACRFLARAPHLHVYVSHGHNTISDDHHRMLAMRIGVSRSLLRRRETDLREGLRPFVFGPEPISVMGYNGLAFTLDGGIVAGSAP